MYRLPDKLIYAYVDCPIGALLVAGDADHVRLISFPTGSRTQQPKADWRRDDNYFRQAQLQLNAYFAGELKMFSFPIRFDGTPFQQSVWKSLCEIPYGETSSYREIATKIGRPKASRAVGAANGANPLPIVVPCHRVIGSNASLTGFGGGIETKRYLLNLEGAQDAQG